MENKNFQKKELAIVFFYFSRYDGEEKADILGRRKRMERIKGE